MDFQLRNGSGQEMKVSGKLKDLEPVLYKLFTEEGYHIMTINGKTAKQMQRDNAKQLEDLQKKVNPKPSKREQRRRIDEIIENRSKKVVGPDEKKTIHDYTAEEIAAAAVTGDRIRQSADDVQRKLRKGGK